MARQWIKRSEEVTRFDQNLGLLRHENGFDWRAETRTKASTAGDLFVRQSRYASMIRRLRAYLCGTCRGRVCPGSVPKCPCVAQEAEETTIKYNCINIDFTSESFE